MSPYGWIPLTESNCSQAWSVSDPAQSWSEVWSLFVLLNWQCRTGVECAVA